MSIDYYENNADRFNDATVGLNMSHLYEPFLSRLPDGAFILDAGCGSGRDSKYFVDLGYRVSAFDASEQMVIHARQLTGLNIQVKQFEQMEEDSVYDGAWCCASLLHVGLSEMLSVMRRVIRSLKKGGVLYMSFKYGKDEREEYDGRHFTDLDEVGLRHIVGQLESISIANIWLTKDKRPEHENLWLNAILLKY